MNFDTVKSKIEDWLQPVLNEKNLFLVDVRFSMGRKIEVYVDSDEGIHIDECAAISRFLENHLDGSGLVPDNYILEVSSPGMDNPLKVPRQFKKRIGRILEVVKNDGTMIEAQLTEADDEKIKLQEVRDEKKKGKKHEKNRPKPVETQNLASSETGMKKTGAKNFASQEPLKEYVLKYDEVKRAVLQFKFS